MTLRDSATSIGTVMMGSSSPSKSSATWACKPHYTELVSFKRLLGFRVLGGYGFRELVSFKGSYAWLLCL